MSTIKTSIGTFHVVNTRTYSVHVPSDNAMIDSGLRIDYTVWRHDLGVTAVMTWGDDNRPTPTPERTPLDVADAAARYAAALRWLGDLVGRARQGTAYVSHKPLGGEVVTVFKGRKCPEGDYRIVEINDEGAYGPYYHLLSEADGRLFRYVSQDNCRLSDAAKAARVREADACQDVPASYRGMVLELARLKWSVSGYNLHPSDCAAAILALCDVLEETGDASVKHVPHLRNHVHAHLGDGVNALYGWGGYKCPDAA